MAHLHNVCHVAGGRGSKETLEQLKEKLNAREALAALDECRGLHALVAESLCFWGTHQGTGRTSV